jgi:hypothetical protein
MPVFNRQALYDQVWETPISRLAEGFGVSDVWLKKCCAKADIPVPERGYWAKHRAGKPVRRVKLPPRAPGLPDIIQIGQDGQRRWGAIDIEGELAKPPPEPPSFGEPIDDVRARVARQLGAVAYRRDFSAPHPLIAKLMADDDIRRRKPDNASYRLRWSDPLFTSPFERRRLKILSALFVALTKAGASPLIGDDEARAISIVVGAERVAIHLDHPDAKPDRDGRYRTRQGFADLLQLAIGGTDKVWSDAVETGLEAHLTDIAIEIVGAGEAQLRSNAQASFVWACKHREDLGRRLVEQRAEADHQARQRAIKTERERQRVLLRLAAGHRRAEQVRGLIDDVIRVRGADPADADRVARWALWAGAVADRIDPIPRLAFDEDGRASLADIPFPETDP